MNTTKSSEPKNKAGVVKYIRIGMQVLSFIFVPGLFITVFSSVGNIVRALLDGSFHFSEHSGECLLVVGVLLMTIIWGRFFCGYICSFGAMQDLFRAAGKRLPIRTRIPQKADRVLKCFKYAVLLFVVIGVWIFSWPGESVWSPWTVFGAYMQPWKGVPAEPLFLSVGGLLLLLTVLGSLLIERFFCKYMCPLGALFALLSRFRLFRIRRSADRCPSACRSCTRSCPMSIPLYSQTRVDSGECINCMRCTGVCPARNIKVDPAPAVSGTVAAAAFAGMTLVGQLRSADSQPAAASEAVTQPGTSVFSDVSQGDIVLPSDKGKYTDGVYTGAGNGFRGTTTVRVTVENGEIAAVDVLSYDDDPQFFTAAQNSTIPKILSSQSTDVDAVSGATFSSRGIIRAVENALSGVGTQTQQTAEPTQDVTPSADDSAPQQEPQTQESTTKTQENTSSPQYADGVYTGAGSGFRGTTTVRVTVENGEITVVDVLSYDDDPQFFSRAQSGVIDRILSAQSVDVSTVSGATFSSNSIREAVADALSISFTNPNPSAGGHGGHSGLGGMQSFGA
ncbi:MAG: FMN-binding protein [Clostridia bacterium]|nr:FMN-binding protein [Clostridia bacterium]